MLGDRLIFCEHKGVITIGRQGSRDNILADEEELRQRGLKVVYTDRGGDVTYHGKGQLVAYPVFDLRKAERDVHLFLRRLELVVITLLKHYGICACRGKDRAGVWVGGEKIASIGIGLTGWVTYHGVGINVSPDLSYFSLINPCGLKNIKVTSIARILAGAVDMKQVKQRLGREFGKVFNRNFTLKVRP